jgi:16S rRNA (cytidine1402-2'-O)-methyltransferase
VSDTATLGTLWLVPTPLDHGCALPDEAPLHEVLPLGTIKQAARLQHWIAENAKSTRAFLKRVEAQTPLPCALQAMDIQVLPREVHKQGDHRTQDLSAARQWLAPLQQGHDVGLVSEAGMPAIADPGSSVVRAAHAMGAPVRALSGPISLMLALASSGLNGQQFAFHGYLPQGEARVGRIQALEKAAWQSGQTQLVIETPYRNTRLLQDLLRTLRPQTRLAVASGLTLQDTVISQRVQEWRTQQAPELPLPSVFLWGP